MMDLEDIVEGLNDLGTPEGQDISEFSTKMDYLLDDLAGCDNDQKYLVFRNMMASYEPHEELTKKIISFAYVTKLGPRLLENTLFETQIGQEYGKVVVGRTELLLPNQRCTSSLKYQIALYLQEEGVMDEKDVSDFCNIKEEEQDGIDYETASLLHEVHEYLGEEEEGFLRENGAKSFYKAYLDSVISEGGDLNRVSEEEREKVKKVFHYGINHQKKLMFDAMKDFGMLGNGNEEEVTAESSEEMLHAYIENPLSAIKNYQNIGYDGPEDNNLYSQLVGLIEPL